MKSEMVKLDVSQCEQIGKLVKNLSFRHDFYKREFLTIQANAETKARAYLYSVAICHQTHSLVNAKKNLKGWDYLEDVFTYLIKSKSEFLDPSYLTAAIVYEVSNKLRILFSPDGNPDNCTLDRLEERARFLVDIGKVLQRYDNKLTNLIKQSNNLLINKGQGLYELLDKFEAYRDPLKKKSTLFIKFLVEADLFEIKDTENLVPMMDYHMQRVLLRMGCVEILDADLKNKLLKRERIDSDEEIRSACVEALKIVSRVSGHDVTKMNDFFWPLGRSCCGEKTLCFDMRCSKSPCTFDLLVELASHEKCVFEGVCKGSLNQEYRSYWQPIVETHYY